MVNPFSHSLILSGPAHFLGNLVPSWLAVILSVSLVLFFGEIFPSAVFTGKNQLAIAAGMSWLVYTLMMVLGPVAWPISWVLVSAVVSLSGRSPARKSRTACTQITPCSLGIT